MPDPRKLSTLGVAVSIAIHAGVFWALTTVPKTVSMVPRSSIVDFEVPEVPVEPERTLPDPTPSVEKDPARVRLMPASVQTAPPAEPEPKPSPEAPQTSSAPAVDLTGLTLTNDNGSAGWGSEVGNGSAMHGPIRTPRQRSIKAAPAPVATEKPRAKAPPVLALADLSERPVPPKLDAILERHYPTLARQQGKSGDAVVRLRIDADGQVRLANIVSETGAGFGQACRSTVLGSRWSAPRDQSGQRVATYASYTCHFRANR